MPEFQNNTRYYITTPIYYVNDRPHIGHVYTTTLADVVARYHRLRGDDTFFLTGTDEHAAKVVDAAAERDLTPQQWADRNAKEFQDTFARLGLTNDDFIRTSEPRHVERVKQYVQQLIDTGDVYLGEYEGWYDAGQEEYVTEARAKESAYVSPINGKPLVKKSEQNYFFKLSKYSEQLLDLLENHDFCSPAARKNEVVARIRDGLNDVPISRAAPREGGERARWGISVPGDDEHVIYVWIDALFNYLSTVDGEGREHYWPADAHVIAKDILWFHAVIWPALLLALSKPLPKKVYAHSFWIAEGQKMSKSLGNFIDLEKIDGYVAEFGLDALRYFLATAGPMGTTDADFAEARFAEVYNTDLANTFGNCASRVSNMIGKYFDGKLPEHGPHLEASEEHAHQAAQAVKRCDRAMAELDVAGAIDAGMALVRGVDGYIEQTRPYTLAKDPEKMPEVGTILYNCAEALRIASLLLWPVIPGKVEALWSRMGCGAYTEALADRGRGDLEAWSRWGQLQPGTVIEKGAALFPRIQK